MPSFAKLFRSKDGSSKKKTKLDTNGTAPPVKAQWSDAWLRTRVDPEEVVELISGCTKELKSRALDLPFLLLPFRPASDPSASRTFVRNYFFPQGDREPVRGDALLKEMRLAEPMVLASVVKWCWSRLPGGVVTWEAYELFKSGEKDSNQARDSFATFIPLSVDSEARKQIIYDFFDLMSAIAAHGKTNGLGGRKLSRYAGWWAFEHIDSGSGFDAGYKAWASAADATSHLFFAYLRTMSPEGNKGMQDMIGLPRSLQQLVQATEYPPETPTLMFNETTKVVMIVNAVSPTPYALLRRAKNFEYRDDDSALQQFSNLDDPVRALTDECRRVLKCISSANQSAISTSKASTSLKDASWSRFEDMGFGATVDESDGEADADTSMLGPRRQAPGLKSQARSVNGDFDRPTTPSWADFLSTGFPDDKGGRSASPMLLPPDKVLPPIQLARGQSSQSHRRNIEPESTLEPGELASIDKLDLDDSFWWVWISSLAAEEPTSRKAVFGRCALIETMLTGGKWMVMEEQVKGSAPEPAAGAYVAEKKGFFRALTSKRGRNSGRKSTLRKGSVTSESFDRPEGTASVASRTNIAPDQQARIHAAAQELQRRHEEQTKVTTPNSRRGRTEENAAKTNSVMTLQPAVLSEASQAMRWASQYDKNEIRSQYLGNNTAGRGSSVDLLDGANGKTTVPESAPLPASSPPPVAKDAPLPNVPLPASPVRETPPELPRQEPKSGSVPPPVDVSAAAVGSSGQPLKESPVLPPSPPASNRASESAAAPTQISKLPTRDSSKSVEPPTPDSMPSQAERESMDSKEQDAEMASRLQKRQAGSGIKALFGSRRPREKSNAKATSPTENGPAVTAARAALHKKSLPNGASEPIAAKSVETKGASSDHPSKIQETMSALAAKSAPNKLSKQRSPSKAPIAAVAPVEPEFEAAPGPDVPRSPIHNRPIAIPSPPIMPTAAPPAMPSAAPPMMPTAAPPRGPTPRSTEGEPLTRVSTKDREHAEREFSSFDQGPLLDQPAFLPGGGSVDPISPVDSDSHSPVKGSNPILPAATATQGKEEALDPDVSDRWAQIRKNAAERAARQNEEGKAHENRTSEDSPADGEEQETIESRVARIKARVAELTGNIESSRA